MASLPSAERLNYTVSESTPHSGKYGPEHILEDDPLNQSSRWSGAYQGSDTKQWVLLKLDRMAILTSITFGKFSKSHPCNTKDFKVYVGTTEDNMIQVLDGSLKNDNIPETFPVRHINGSQVIFTTRYVKIVPISAHGQNFHVSLWHVGLSGITDRKFVERMYKIHEEHRESTVLRHILKHLRQRRLLTPYQDILSRAFASVEHPLITQLHTTLVLQGAFKDAEKHLRTLSSAGIFHSYLQSSIPFGRWTRILGTDRDGDLPPPRSGHAMCLDYDENVIYVHGGYDGTKSLDDFWVYYINEDRWQKINDSTESEANGPSPRSCHKMTFDSRTGNIYVLGRLADRDAAGPQVPPPETSQNQEPQGMSRGGVERLPTVWDIPTREPTMYRHILPPPPPSTRPPPPPAPSSDSPTAISYCSEFYRYRTRGVDKGRWEYLNFDTASSGGPPLCFDHQMAIDSESQVLYVHGGVVLDGSFGLPSYGGLYAYNIRASKWKTLQSADNLATSIPPRSGHSMVFDPPSNTLFIFAGQDRDGKYLSDMYAYDLNTRTATELFSDYTISGGPIASYTQRAMIDTDLREIYVFCGVITDITGMPHFLPSETYNWVYRYNTRPGYWARIGEEPRRGANSKVPCPRHAHDAVYHPKIKQVYIFGGNTVKNDEEQATDVDDDMKRVNDFWKMEICRPGTEEIIRQATFKIRRQQFREMCEDGTPTQALAFLQSQISSVVNHADKKETEDYRSLMTFLLAPKPTAPPLLPSFIPAPILLPKAMPSTSSESESSKNTSRTSVDSKSGSIHDADTNSLVDDDDDSLPNVYHHLSADLLRSVEDPIERQLRGDSKERPMSADRYAQRMEVFEGILEYVGERDKEPTGSLLDFVTRNDNVTEEYD